MAFCDHVPGIICFVDTLIDKIYWAKFIAQCNSPIIWMDYSMNLKLTEKNQVPSAHFSGKQQTFHDAFIQRKGVPNNYIYHLSDDINHDSVMTHKILTGIIKLHTDVLSGSVLNLRSDNCSTQYKSLCS